MAPLIATRRQNRRIETAKALMTVEALTASDFSWIDQAIREATKSKHRVRVGAVLIVGPRISKAFNRIRNSPEISHLHATTHAEIGALKRVPRAKGGTIYVARLGSQGRLLPSFPCSRCFPALAEAGIRRIVWWNGERWVRMKM